jgi:hypothetical protein
MEASYLKRWSTSARLQGEVSKKVAIFIFAAVRTRTLTYLVNFEVLEM